MPFQADALMLEDLRRFNHRLARAPRLGYRHAIVPRLGQGLLRLTQIGADARLRRQGVRVENTVAARGGLRVPVRVLRPAQAPRAVVLDIHGGGWVIGNPAMNDVLNAAIVRACGVAVVSVDYRLAPRAPLAAMMDDCLAAACWLLEGGPGDGLDVPVIVLGESAGAHLAAATLQNLRAWPALLARIAGVVLYYGVYDLAGSPSVRAAGPQTLLLHGPSLLPGLRLLTPGLDDEARRRPPLSPLYGVLSAMPPALMVTGGADPLRDDTLQMAARWREAAAVELVDLPEAPHGIIHFPTRMGRAVQAHTHAWIDRRITGPAPPAPAGA